MKRKALGKGLDALLPDRSTGSDLRQIDIDEIKPNEFQPRMAFETEKLDELAASISENGVIQPIIVRRSGEGFELVAGERRWRAAQKAGLQRIPALVQEVSDEKLLELALVENIQRDELSPIEEAHAYQLLTEEFSLSQQEIARRVGRSRTAVTNTLRLLRLPKTIQGLVVQHKLSMGHARALIPLGKADQLKLAEACFKNGLSVREVERRAKQLLQPPKPRKAKDANIRAAEQRLQDSWKTKVEIRRRGRHGQIVLHFYSDAELDRLYEALADVQ
jgi:ParB family chromosome partitioning protein